MTNYLILFDDSSLCNKKIDELQKTLELKDKQLKDILLTIPNIPDNSVIIGSTGVIGAQLPMDKMIKGVGSLAKQLGNTPEDATPLKTNVAFQGKASRFKNVAMGALMALMSFVIAVIISFESRSFIFK